MKLLLCPNCSDIIKLTYKKKSCECGYVKGYYEDRIHAVTNGKGYCIAIGNGSIENAIRNLHMLPDDLSRNEYIGKCRVEYCWIRPHDGNGNRHTRVDENI